MNPPGACSRESSSHATIVFRLFLVLLIVVCTAIPASAQYQTYPITTTVSSVPAGSYGATFLASTIDPSATANFKVCFDTGYGSSKVPIVPYNYVNPGRVPQFNFNVPASTIQAVPPAAFVNGSFAVSIYSIPTNYTACNGNEPGTPQGNTVTLNYPILRSVSLSELPEQNVALKTREPSSLALTGANFINNSGTSGKVPSAVNFVSTTSLTGAVKFVSSSSLVSTIPTTIPAEASSVAIQVCNTATYSYCSNSLTLKTVALQQNPGKLTASPNPALSTQPVTLTANFGPVTHTVAGAPSGLVTFSDGGTALGASKLVLDSTAAFTQAPTQQFLTYALPIAPIVADFNGDGIPDTLLIDPGTGNSGATLNLLLGTVPSGSFKANRQFTVLGNGTSFIITSAAVGDFNGDGIPDVALLAKENVPGAVTNPTLYTLIGKGDGTFHNGFSSSPILYGSQIVAGDFNKDGKQDIVIAGALDAKGTIGLQTFLGDGRGNFNAGPATTGLRTAPSPYFGDFKVVAADFNADGYPDIAVMNGYSPQGQLDNSIELYQNTGKGFFTAPVRVQTDGTPTANFFVAALGPGQPIDIIVISTASQFPGVDVALNQSTTSKIAFFDTFQGTEVSGITQAVIGDFDGDGLLDVAVQDQKTIHVLSGTGEGNFTRKYATLSFPRPANATLVAASDENGDKYADLLLYTAGAQDGNTRYPITLYDYVTAGTATATLPAATFAVGTHALQASTNGTFNILAGTATATLNSSGITPSIVLTSSPGSPQAYVGSTTTLIGTLFDSSQNLAAGSTAAGTASFYNGTTLVGTAPLVRTVGNAGDANDSANLKLVNLPVGTYTFTVRYPGDSNHSAATSRPLVFQVTPGTPSITWKPNPATIAYGTPLSAAQLDAVATGVTGETVPGTFTYVPGLGTVLGLGSNRVVATFKPSDPNYTGITTNQNIVVTQATPAITWKPAPATIGYGTALSAAQLDATSSTPGTFVYTPATGTVLATGTHILSTTFTPKDTVNFKALTTTANIVVTIATPAVTWTPNPAAIPYGTALSAAQLDAVSATPGTFTYTPASGTLLSAGTQTLSVLFTPKDAVNFKSLTSTATITVTQIVPTITWLPNPATIPYGSALSAAQLDATANTPGTFTYTPALGTVLNSGAQTLTAIFAPRDTTDFKSVTTTTSITVTGVNPVVSWKPNPATIAYGTALSASQLDATSTIPGTFVYTPALGTVLTAGTQTLSVLFTPTDLVNYKPLTSTATIIVAPIMPTVTWSPNPATIPYGTALSVAQLDATSTVPGTFTYTPALGTVLAAGTHTLSALFTPKDATDFSPITTTATIVVTQVSPAITWKPTPATIAYGTALSAAQLDATSSVPGTFAYTPALGALLPAGTQPLTAVFTPTDAVDYKSITTTTSIVVTGVSPTIAWKPNPATIPYGTALSAAQLDATSATPGTFAYTPAAGTVLPAGTQALSVLFTPTDTVNFKPLTSTAVITVTQIAPAITWIPNPSDISYGTPLSAAQLDATSATPGTFLYTPVLGTVLAAGPHLLSVTFTPNDLINFKSVATTANVLVGTVQPTITWVPNPATITFGTALSASQLDATANTPGSFTYTPALGTVLNAGPHLLSVTFNPTDTTDFNPITRTVPITVDPVAPTVTWNPNPSTIAFGTPLSAAQFNATSPLPGAYTYGPGNGAILTAGTQTLTLRFHPTDNNYSIINLTRTITVTQAKPTITWATPASITFGTAISATQLDAVATGVSGLTLPGTFTYTPANGTVLQTGASTLSVLFTPTDAIDYTSATASIIQTVGLPATITRLATSSNSSEYGQPVTFTASTLAGTQPATGTTNFFDGTTLIGSSTSSPATLTTSILTAGTHTIVATFVANGSFAGSTSTALSQKVSPAATTIAWAPNPATIAFNTPLSAAQLDASVATTYIKPVAGVFAYTPALGSVLNTGLQTLRVTFTPTDAVDYLASSATALVTVTSIDPLVAWTPNPATITYGTPLSAAQLDATSIVPGTFTYTPAIGALLTTGIHTLTLRFQPAGSNYNAVTLTRTITVAAAGSVVAWVPNPATITYGTALSAAQLDATSSTPGTFTYTPALGSILTAGVQTLSVLFTPADTVNFKPQTSTANITVTQGIPVLTWKTPAAITFGTALSALQLDATATGIGSTALPGTFTYTPASGTVLSAGSHTLSVLFTPTDATDFKTVTSAVTLVVTSTGSTVTWIPNPATISYGTALSAAQLDATSTTPGTFVYTPALGTVLTAGTQTLSVLFTPTDLVNFKPVTTTASIVISKAKPSLLWSTPAAITFGTPLSATQLNATATGINRAALPGTFTYAPAAGTVLGAGTSTLSVLFTPTDAADYTTATATVLQTVRLLATTIVLTSPLANTQFGQPITFTATITSTGAVTGTVNFYDGSLLIGQSTANPASLTSSTLSVGTHAISAAFTSSQNSTDSTSNALSQKVTAATTSLVWAPNPATITYGTALSASQLDATVSTPYTKTVAGTFAYTPASGTVLAAGTQTLKVTFTPTNAVDYLPSSGSALVNVTGATPAITWAPAPATITYGTALSSAQLNAASSTPGTFTYTPALGTVPTVGTQTLSVLFTPTDTVHYKSVTSTATLTVIQATPAVTWLPNPATIAYGTALSASQLDATSSTPGTFVYTPALGTVLAAGTQTLTAVFTPNDAKDFKSITTTVTIVVTIATPVVSWIPNPATLLYGTALSSAQLDASANTAGTFVYTPAAGTVLPAGTQTLSALFTPKDLTDFKPIATTTTIVVSAITPTVTWTPNPATITYGTGLTAAQLNATSTTAGTFLYTPGLGTILTAGTQTLSAVFTPSDAANFKPFTTTATITVTPAIPTITWTPNPATLPYGTPLSTAQLDARSTLPGTFVYTPALGTILSAGTQTLSTVFTPNDAVNYKSVTATAIIAVTAVTPTITWTPTAATIAYGTALSAAQLDATSTTPGTFVYTPALGTVLATGTQTLTAVFTPKDVANFKSVTSSITIVVTAASPTIVWTPNPAIIAYGTALSAAQLDATSTTPGTFVYTPALGSVLSAGTQTISVAFTPTDTTNFKPVTATATVTVTAATPTITWTPTPATITYGTPLSAAQLDATSATPGTFLYAPALGSVLSAGTQTLSVAFTPTDAKDFKPVTTTATITVTASNPVITWTPSPATITYGTPLSSAQLNATSNTPGTFVYTPALGSILTAGTQTLTVAFTPTDSKNFKSLTATAAITVTIATPALNWLPSPATIPYGTALSTAQLDASSTTPGSFVYTPALGAILAAGTQTLSVTFTPTDTKDFKSLNATVSITVQQTAPTILWTPPASIIVGTALSSAQLDARATGANGAALPGTFTYTPASGAVLPAGAQTLKVTFSPTDLANYTTASASVSLQVIPVTLISLSSTQAALGDPAKTITLTGTGFVSSAIVQINGSAIPTTFVNVSTLTAIIPAADFLLAQILQINVAEAAQNQTTSPIAFIVGAPLASAVFAGPSSIQPGTDTELNFKLTNPYPVDLAANFTLSFTPAAGLPSDPGVLFANGKTTYAVIVPANSTATPSVAIQGSTVAGSMTVTLSLEAGGVNVTPPSVQPLVIQAPLAVPGVSSASVTKSGNMLTVVVRGLSNPRDMASAKFHFTPVAGGSIGTEDVTIDVVPIFTTWYADPASLQYGSTFTYTQTFNLSSDASVVGQVSVTLTNSVGVSQEADTP